jgi:hypothetical protein
MSTVGHGIRTLDKSRRPKYRRQLSSALGGVARARNAGDALQALDEFVRATRSDKVLGTVNKSRAYKGDVATAYLATNAS